MKTPASTASEDRLAWFRQARFGLFITWGLHALLGRGEWAYVLEGWRPQDYAPLADRFTARRFDADQWATLARQAGMRYAVFVARHADGYCLFDSQHSVGDFTSVRTAAGRDFTAEYVEAFRRQGLKVGIYYHLGDWREPGYFDPEQFPRSAERMRQSAHEQVRELMSQYGKIDILWYDGWYWEHGRGNLYPGLPRPMAGTFWRAEKLNRMVRELQPGILINDRSGPEEDFGTPEQRVAAERQGRAWEACMTIGRHWGWSRELQRKTPAQLLMQLVEAASQGGNLLLNVGPRADGSIDPQESRRLQAMGRWLDHHGDAIFSDVRPAPQWWHLSGRCAIAGSTAYFYLYEWPGREAILPELDAPVRRAWLMATGQELGAHVDANQRTVFTGLPARPPAPHLNVIAFECEGDGPPRFADKPRPCWWPDDAPA